MKIVINRCYGGFGLSGEAVAKLVDRGCDAVRESTPDVWGDGWIDLGFGAFQKHRLYGVVRRGDCAYVLRDDDSVRSHPGVIAVVEEMGAAANGQYAKLKIVEVPDDVQWEIDDYDGIETVREVSQSWR